MHYQHALRLASFLPVRTHASFCALLARMVFVFSVSSTHASFCSPLVRMASVFLITITHVRIIVFTAGKHGDVRLFYCWYVRAHHYRIHCRYAWRAPSLLSVRAHASLHYCLYAWCVLASCLYARIKQKMCRHERKHVLLRALL